MSTPALGWQSKAVTLKPSFWLIQSKLLNIILNEVVIASTYDSPLGEIVIFPHQMYPKKQKSIVQIVEDFSGVNQLDHTVKLESAGHQLTMQCAATK